MTHGATALVRTFRILAFAAALCVPPTVFADDYADVAQLMRSGKAAEAQARIDRYLAAKPRDPQMRFLLGVLQSDTARTADAITTFTHLTQEYPELPEPYNNLAVLYAGQGDFDKARGALELAVRTNPGYATAHENLGDVYAELASQSYGRARELDPRNTSVAPKLALIRQLLGPATNPAKPAATAPGAPPRGKSPAG